MFMVGEDTNFVQLGINSFGPCGHPSIPGVYTRITKYKEWIQKTLHHNPKDESLISEGSTSCDWPSLDDILSGSIEAIAKYKECFEKNQYQISTNAKVTSPTEATSKGPR